MLPAPIVSLSGASLLPPWLDCRPLHGAKRCILRNGSQRTRSSQSRFARFALGSEPRLPCSILLEFWKHDRDKQVELTSTNQEDHGSDPHLQTADPPSLLVLTREFHGGICSFERIGTRILVEQNGWAPCRSHNQTRQIRQSGWRDRMQQETGWHIRSR